MTQCSNASLKKPLSSGVPKTVHSLQAGIFCCRECIVCGSQSKPDGLPVTATGGCCRLDEALHRAAEMPAEFWGYVFFACLLASLANPSGFSAEFIGRFFACRSIQKTIEHTHHARGGFNGRSSNFSGDSELPNHREIFQLPGRLILLFDLTESLALTECLLGGWCLPLASVVLPDERGLSVRIVRVGVFRLLKNLIVFELSLFLGLLLLFPLELGHPKGLRDWVAGVFAQVSLDLLITLPLGFHLIELQTVLVDVALAARVRAWRDSFVTASLLLAHGFVLLCQAGK